MLKPGVVSFFVTAVLVACSSSDDDSSTGTGQVECSDPTQCQSGLCLTLKENEQKKAGICTSQCTNDAGCSGGKCIDIPTQTAINKICLSSCAVDADCKNGFICTTSAQGNVCLVRDSVTPVTCVDDSGCTEAKAQCITSSGGAKICSRALDAPDVFQRECAPGGAKDCPGLSCLTFKANKQNKTGVCTMNCADDTDCPGGGCKEFTNGDKICLATCTADADCLGGLVCVPEPSRKFCGVTPN